MLQQCVSKLIAYHIKYIKPVDSLTMPMIIMAINADSFAHVNTVWMRTPSLTLNAFTVANETGNIKHTIVYHGL